MENVSVIRVSVSEAARLFGVSQKTIREAIKAQELRYIVVKNRYKIHFESLVHWSQLNKRRSNRRDQLGIGQYVDQWKPSAVKFSPRAPQPEGPSETNARHTLNAENQSE